MDQFYSTSFIAADGIGTLSVRAPRHRAAVSAIQIRRLDHGREANGGTWSLGESHPPFWQLRESLLSARIRSRSNASGLPIDATVSARAGLAAELRQIAMTHARTPGSPRHVPSAKGTQQPSRSLIRALDILFAVAEEPAMLKELAGRVALGTATTYRLAMALADAGLLSNAGRSGFRLGTGIIELARAFDHQSGRRPSSCGSGGRLGTSVARR